MSFAAAAFLAGLATLALPWALHRLETRDPRARTVSSLFLMRADETPRARHRTLRYRRLLVLRLLLLAVLSFAFAQPLLERLGTAATAATSMPQVVVLDTSLSMAAAMDEARNRALRVIDDLPSGTPGAVLGAAAELTVLAGPTTDHAVLAAAVSGAVPSATRLAFDGLLGRVATRMAALIDERPRVHLISDFQTSAMPERFNALVAGNDLPVTFHAVGGQHDNWQVTAAVDGDRLEVAVRSHAAAARRLNVVVEGAAGELERQAVEIAAGDAARVSVALPPAGATDRWLSARIEAEDAIAADDAATVVVPGTASFDLPLYAAPGAERQVDYLSAAVRAAAPRFRPRPGGSGLDDSGQEAAAGVDGPVAAALDAGGLGALERRRLERHLAGGGGVLVSAGNGTRRGGALPFGGPVLRSGGGDGVLAGPRSVIGVDTRYPSFGAPAAWRHVQVFRHLPVDAIAGVALSLDDGTPLLVEYPAGAGRVLALTTALDPQWSSLVSDAAFVELIGGALDHLAEERVPTGAIAGEPLSLGVANAQLFDGAGRRLLTLGDSAARGNVRLERPGVYTLRTPNRERLLAVNPDPRESLPEAADPELLARWQGAVGSRPAAPTSAASVPDDHLSLAPWLLAVLLALALLEPAVANLGRTEPGR